MITQDEVTNEYVLWKTETYTHGIEVKRMGDLERLKIYAARRARVEWETQRKVPKP